MRTPLDYYRILGLPLQAKSEQLQQAHRDRALQLPRREYSELAIEARRELLDEAYTILSDPIDRRNYDAQLRTGEDAQEPGSEGTTAYIEIAEHQFIGALLLLQELGEYEIVLKLGIPRLSNPRLQMASDAESEIVHADLVLTVALAYLELGREYWQQGHYESAAEALEAGQELLLKEGLFAAIRGEIQGDLYKLRPYRVLELVALPEEHQVERRRGIQLLRDMLQERGGIDGTADDHSGLRIDDFLRFIQQLRDYLTAEEQLSLFETEAHRPSAVAMYLAVYALMAQGFAAHQPQRIQKSHSILMHLGQYQDVHLEQAISLLLLGQTEAASRALDLSREYEALACIRERSQGAPDLLPGLCAYAEQWLRNEVFPHFRDLANAQTTLKEYFADEQVQVQLEHLPADATPSQEWQAVSGKMHLSQHTLPSVSSHVNGRVTNAANARPSTSVQVAGDTNSRLPNTPVTATSSRRVRVRSPRAEELPVSGLRSKNQSKPPSRGTTNLSDHPTELLSAGNNGQALKATPPAATAPHTSVNRSARRHSALKFDRLIFVLGAGILLMAGVAYGVATLLKWVGPKTQEALTLNPTTEETLEFALDQPIISVVAQATTASQTATAISETLEADALGSGKGSDQLSESQAQQIVERWLRAKGASISEAHDVAALDQVLTGQALEERRFIARSEQQDGLHADYEFLILGIEEVITDPEQPQQASIIALVNETANYYKNGQPTSEVLSANNLRVRYDLRQEGDGWKIASMRVVR